VNPQFDFEGPGLVKICGLREPEHAEAAAGAGADLLGFIFAPTRRQVTAEQARACIAAARKAAAPREVRTVGVFVEATPAEVNSIVESVGVDLVQLHGHPDRRVLGQLLAPAVVVIRLSPGSRYGEARRVVDRYSQGSSPPVAFLVDGYDPDSHGGTGKRADWELAAALADLCPLVLAGGLTSENVGEAVRAVRPRAVDVSSGVESNGVKDSAKIEAFVREAKAAFGASEI